MDKIRLWAKRNEAGHRWMRHGKYLTVVEWKGTHGTMDAMLRWSSVPRNGEYQIDVVQIKATPPRKGAGSEFVRYLIAVGNEVGRGVYLENTITEASRAFAASLVKKQGFREFQNMCWIRKRD